MRLNEIKELDKEFKNIIKSFILKFIFLTLVYIAISFSSVYPTRLLGNIIDTMTVDNGLSRRVLQLLVFYIFIRLVNLVLNFISRYWQESIRSNLESELRIESISKLLNIRDLNNLKTLQSSQYVTRIFETIQGLVDSILNLILWFGKSLPILLFTFYFIFQINYIIGILIIPFIILMALLTKYLSRKQKKVSKLEIESKSKLIDFFHEIVESFETIKIFNTEDYMINKAEGLESNWKSNRINTSMISSASFLSLSLFGIIITSLILFLSTANSTSVKAGEITSLILYTGNIFILIMDVFNNIIIFSELESSLKRFNDIFTGEDKKLSSETKNNLLNWDIEFKNVSFDYKGKKIIENMSFCIPEGSKIGIVGKNGSGKSTLLKLISGLYRPRQGQVYLGNIPIENIEEQVIRDNMSYAQQNPYIYNDKISNNISLGLEYNEDRIDSLVKICNMENLIREFEDTILYNNGANLSGGQRQKIGLARTLIRDPKILLLDEYTSSLDRESQKTIFDYLMSLDKTLIFITHDYSFLTEMDLIIYLDGSGKYYIDSHDNLIENLKEYRDFIYTGKN